jgi:hypothetical protein
MVDSWKVDRNHGLSFLIPGKTARDCGMRICRSNSHNYPERNYHMTVKTWRAVLVALEAVIAAIAAAVGRKGK